MDLSVVKLFSERKKADLLVLPFWNMGKKAIAAFAGKEFFSFYESPLKTGDFKAKDGECLLLYTKGSKDKEKRILLLGLGEKKKNRSETLRRSCAAAVKVARDKSCKSVNFVLPTGDLTTLRVMCEGVLLTNYSFDELRKEVLKEKPTALLEKVCFVLGERRMLSDLKKLQAIIEGVKLTRDLANHNAEVVSPQELCAQARKLQKKFPKIKTKVFGKKELEKQKMGLILAVNQGSARDPALIIMEYHGNPKSKEKTAIVGKGITYDTGGLNLKSTGHIETMKLDMSGAATVLGTLYAAAALSLKANLVGVIPTTENAIGPKSYLPGDVYTSYAGKTVEIANTDAEGRLILADALSYTAQVIKPTRMIDLATLTGAIVIALGENVTGLFTNNDRLARALTKAGEETGEEVWRMPLVSDYKEELKSNFADLKNCGSRKGSSITAALFLQEFVKETPWAHLDIAGTAHRDPKHYNTTHASGVGVRLLISFLQG